MQDAWYQGGAQPTCRAIADHARLIKETDQDDGCKSIRGAFVQFVALTYEQMLRAVAQTFCRNGILITLAKFAYHHL